jgi:hypothetical protein
MSSLINLLWQIFTAEAPYLMGASSTRMSRGALTFMMLCSKKSALPYIFSAPIYAQCKCANVGTTSKEETMAKEKDKGKSDKGSDKSKDKSKASKSKSSGKSSKSK